MAKVEVSIKDIIKILREEALKEYREYDAQFRPQYVYQANTEAEQNEYCLKTEYAYDGTSNRIVKKRETVDRWQSIWDI